MEHNSEYKTNFQKTKKSAKKYQGKRRARLPRKAKKKTMLRKMHMEDTKPNMRMIDDGLPL